jgi:hypothetical protein
MHRITTCAVSTCKGAARARLRHGNGGDDLRRWDNDVVVASVVISSRRGRRLLRRV